MRKLHIIIVICMIMSMLSACQAATPAMQIQRYPQTENWIRETPASLPVFDPDSTEPFQVDLRSKDLTQLDLSERLDDLMYASFDIQTKWPAEERMPADFDHQRIFEMGKDPGLGVRELHQRGIDGRGVGIAIIDQPLLVEHPEYAGRLRLYEEIGVNPSTPAQMHGPAVASIAVGKSVGVAPGADLYYIGSWSFDGTVPTANYEPDYRFYAQAIHRIIEINQQLPANQKIRVISISNSWVPGETGYDEVSAAVLAARDAGMLVLSTNVERQYGFKINGLGRPPLADPQRFESYEPGLFWASRITDSASLQDRLLIPMDSRTTAGFTGTSDYAFYRAGGWSWIIPYLSGVYALAAQVEPGITPQRFYDLAMQTGRTIQIPIGGEAQPFGPIIDPVALIEALEAEQTVNGCIKVFRRNLCW
jgi:hypothetical protein